MNLPTPVLAPAQEKPTCFVIQQFGGTYDNRYTETIYPALVKAGVEPKRADEILGQKPIVEKIKEAIEKASVCLVEVSENNPNVWLELGYAFALGKPTVMLCDTCTRILDALPFDIKHLTVIPYEANHAGAFKNLKKDIIKHVKYALVERPKLIQSAANVPEVQFIQNPEDAFQLNDSDKLILATIFQFQRKRFVTGFVEYDFFNQLLENQGINSFNIEIGIDRLEKYFLIEESVQDIQFGRFESEPGLCYRVTKKGRDWLHLNQHKIPELSRDSKSSSKPAPQSFHEMEDDIPF